MTDIELKWAEDHAESPRHPGITAGQLGSEHIGRRMRITTPETTYEGFLDELRAGLYALRQVTVTLCQRDSFGSLCLDIDDEEAINAAWERGSDHSEDCAVKVTVPISSVVEFLVVGRPR